MKPAFDQIQITTFGPGFGECTVAHLGNDNWIVVDSCLDSKTHRPVALEYLNSIGVSPNSVKLVVATHWHDDHVRGMAEQLSAFSEAIFCSSPALTNTEFVASVVAFESRHGIVAGSGVSELSKVLEILSTRMGKSTPRRVSPARKVFELSAELSGHGEECSVYTLSPSDKQFEKFLLQVGSLVPLPLEAKRRAPDQEKNDLSIVVLIRIGEESILLGADLEEVGDLELGWSAVVNLQERPSSPARIFKIPHHGSKTSHHQPVWDKMLHSNPLSILTPWNKGPRGLPLLDDMKRILANTHSAFSTSRFFRTQSKARDSVVEKQIKETVGKISAIQFQTGWVRLQNGGANNKSVWSIEHSDEACHLKEWSSQLEKLAAKP